MKASEIDSDFQVALTNFESRTGLGVYDTLVDCRHYVFKSYNTEKAEICVALKHDAHISIQAGDIRMSGEFGTNIGNILSGKVPWNLLCAITKAELPARLINLVFYEGLTLQSADDTFKEWMRLLKGSESPTNVRKAIELFLKDKEEMGLK